MSKIRVLMVAVTLAEGSGVNTFMMNYFRKLDHAKIRMDVLVYRHGCNEKSPYEEEIRQAGGKVYPLPSVKQPIRHIRTISRILWEGNYHIVHNNSLIETLPLMVLSRVKGIPIRILHSHSTKLGDTKAKTLRNALFFPFLLHSCNRYFACSDAAGRAKFGKKPYTVVPNVVDAEDYPFSVERRNKRREKEGVAKKNVILSVGRISPEKNPLFALKVFQKLYEKNKDVVYWWVGDGPQLPRVKAEAERLGIQDHVVFWGRQLNMAEFYEAADVFFLPSLFEGLPLTGIESQAMGLPSVVSDTVTREMVYTDLVSFVSLNAPVETWIDALEKQIARLSQRRSYGEELRNSVFSAENAGRNMEKLYEDLLTDSK